MVTSPDLALRNVIRLHWPSNRNRCTRGGPARTGSRALAGRGATHRCASTGSGCPVASCTTSTTSVWAIRCAWSATTTAARSCGQHGRRAVALHDDLPAPPRRAPRRPHPGRGRAVRDAGVRARRRVPQARPGARARRSSASIARCPATAATSCARPTPASPSTCSSRRCAPPSAKSRRRARSSSARRACGGATSSTCAPSPIVAGSRARRPATWPSTRPRAPTSRRPPAQGEGLGARDGSCAPARARAAQAAFELHAQAEPQADAVRAHAAAAAAEARRYPPAASGRYPNELAYRAHQAIARDERVRIRIRGQGRDRRARITACADAEPRNGIALALTLHTGERVHLADVALIAHATPKPRDRHDPRLAACAPIRPPRPLPDQEPPLLHHPHRAARSAPRARRPPTRPRRRRSARARRRATARGHLRASLRRTRASHSCRRAPGCLSRRPGAGTAASGARGAGNGGGRSVDDKKGGAMQIDAARIAVEGARVDELEPLMTAEEVAAALGVAGSSFMPGTARVRCVATSWVRTSASGARTSRRS